MGFLGSCPETQPGLLSKCLPTVLAITAHRSVRPRGFSWRCKNPGLLSSGLLSQWGQPWKVSLSPLCAIHRGDMLFFSSSGVAKSFHRASRAEIPPGHVETVCSLIALETGS